VRKVNNTEGCEELTLIVAFKGKISRDSDTEGIVVASDTQATSMLKEPVQKIFQLGNLPILAGGSGSISLVRHTISHLDNIFVKSQRKLGRKMACRDFDGIINSNVELCLRKIVKSHLDVIEQDSLSLILGFSDKTNVRLYQVQSDGVPMRMDENPGYCCVGKGYSTGGGLLIQQFYSSDLSLIQLTMLALYTISQVSKVDYSVGSEIEARFNFGGNVMNPKKELLRERLELRSENIRRVWNLLESEDISFERSFSKAVGKREFRDIIKNMK